MPRLKRGRGIERLVATYLSGPLPEAQLRTWHSEPRPELARNIAV